MKLNLYDDDDHHVMNDLNRVFPLIPLTFDVQKNCDDYPHFPSQIQYDGVWNDDDDVFDGNCESGQIHVTIHFRYPMFCDFDDVVYLQKFEQINKIDRTL